MATEIGPEDFGLTVPEPGEGLDPAARVLPPSALPEAEDPRCAGIAALLKAEPWSFDFFHAVRLLEKIRLHREPVGRFGDPRREVIRFGAHPSVAFPASSIQGLDLRDDPDWKMVVNFLGLTGPMGVLPRLYTVTIQERARLKDFTLRDFLDMFNHRMTSLFFRAWSKYRLPVRYPRGMDDQVSRSLLSIVGLGTAGLTHRQEVADETLVWFSGLLGAQARSAIALEQLVEDYFGVPVEVQQFVGAWYTLDSAYTCTLDEDEDPSEQLGLGAVVGDEVFDQQARVRVRIGPLTLAEYRRLLPGGSGYRRLTQLTRFFGRNQIDFEAQLILKREDVPACEFAREQGEALQLGWTTWMKSRPTFPRDPEDAILFLQ